MAKKEVVKTIKLQIPAGRANPAPPVGTALGPTGVSTQEFCSQFNEKTKEQMGDVLPVVINVYEDRTFDFEIKTPPAAFLIKKVLNLKKGSSNGANEKVATMTESQLREIAETKLKDLNAYDVESAMKIIEGTARNMGVEIQREEK